MGLFGKNSKAEEAAKKRTAGDSGTSRNGNGECTEPCRIN